VRSTAFVGRREELAVLEDAVRRADASEPQVVLVSGGAGVGKTRLLGQLADQIAGTGSWVLRTACVELGPQGLPLAPATAALRQLAGQVPLATMAAMVPGADALWRLLPESGGSSPGPDRPARLLDLFGLLQQRLGTVPVARCPCLAAACELRPGQPVRVGHRRRHLGRRLPSRPPAGRPGAAGGTAGGRTSPGSHAVRPAGPAAAPPPCAPCAPRSPWPAATTTPRTGNSPWLTRRAGPPTAPPDPQYLR
jgi:hypothetical protein